MDEEAEIAPSIAIPELTRGPQANHPSSVPVNENTDTNTIISNPNAGTVVTRIEGILAQIINALAAGQELSIPFSARRSTRRAANVQPEQVHFPGRNQQEAVKFGQISADLFLFV
jgi:meiotic recombination protein SPO11